MKKISVLVSILAGFLVLFLQCGKKPPIAPVADEKLQSSVEVSHALYTFLDAEQMVSFVGEQDQSPKFYMPAANSGSATVTSTPPGQNTNGIEQPGIFSLDYSAPSSSTVCLCADGRKRGGSVGVGFSVSKNSIDYPPPSPDKVNENSIYFRRYGFGAHMTFENYYVDDWKIDETNYDFMENLGDRIIIKNNLITDKFMGATSNISWDIKGNFKIKKGTDSTLCHISITKVLLSSNNPSVYPPPSGSNNTDAPIKWAFINPSKGEGVKVGYYGTVNGFTSGHVPFTYEIKKEQMLIRDFACYPNKISGISVNQSGDVMEQKEEYHPFINGVASFTTGVLYPRQILYGGSETSGEGQCDNSGTVLIKGILYPVDFLK